MMKSIRRSGFTLIEMLVVISIIALLAGLVVGSASYVRDKQMREKAKAQVALLSKALEEYNMDMGEYPGLADDTPEEGDVSEELYQALFKDGYDFTSPATPPDNWEKARKIYVPLLDPRDNKQGWVEKVAAGAAVPPDLKILDPWGKPYRYRKGANAQNPDYDLWSLGKDGKTNTGNGDADVKHKDNRDDVKGS